MAYNPQFNDIGSQFVQAYYQAYEAAANPEDRALKLAGFYHDTCFFTFEDFAAQGKEAILNKIKSLPITKIAHNVTKCDCQPMADGGVIVVIIGQLKTDDDPPMPYAHTFILKNETNSFFIAHEFFRLCVHNF